MGRQAGFIDNLDNPTGVRKVVGFLTLTHIEALDREVMRRKANREDRGPDGKKIFVNRQTVIRDLLDVWMDSGLTVDQIRDRLT
jgi:hypothetical protein